MWRQYDRHIRFRKFLTASNSSLAAHNRHVFIAKAKLTLIEQEIIFWRHRARRPYMRSTVTCASRWPSNDECAADRWRVVKLDFFALTQKCIYFATHSMYLTSWLMWAIDFKSGQLLPVRTGFNNEPWKKRKCAAGVEKTYLPDLGREMTELWPVNLGIVRKETLA